MAVERPGDRAPEASLASASAILAVVLAALAGLQRLAGFRLTTLLPGLSDLTSYFLPKYEFAAARVREGALPLWNPYELLGLPFLATMQPGVLYPPVRAVYLALDGDGAYLALLVLHLAIGAFLSLLLARSLGLSIAACVLASSWVILPTWLIRVGEHPIYFEAVAWMPGLLLLGRRLVLAPSARGIGLLAGAAAMLTLSGYPPFALAAGYALLLGLPFWLFELRATRGRALPSLAALVASALLAAALCAAQVLPAAAWLPESQRADLMTSWRALPTLSGDLAYLLGLPEETLAGSLRDVWLEFGPALLALAALSAWRRGLGAPVAFAAALFAVATLVPFRALGRLPFYEQVRFGLEWTFLAPIPLFLLAGIGLDALQQRVRASRAAALALAVGALLFTGGWSQGRIPERWRAARPERVRELPAGVAERCDLRPGRFRFFWPSLAAHGVALASRRASIAGVEQSIPPYRSARLAMQVGVETYLPLDWLRGFPAHPGLLRRMALRCVISEERQPLLETAAAGFRRQPRRAAGLNVYRRDDSLPRLRMAFEAVAAGSPEEALARIGDASLDPERVVVLEDAPPPLAACAAPRRATVGLLRVDEEAIDVRVDASCPGYLVVADTWASGWIARVDGEPAAILRADYAFRAVAIPPGRHRVQMEYRPASVRWGIRVSLLAAGTLFVLLALPAARDPFRGGGDRHRGYGGWMV